MNADATIASEPCAGTQTQTNGRPNRPALTRQASRPSRGFTIVELLTVVGIIALLMAIAFPALRGVQTRARKTIESNNIRQVYLAWTVYGNFNRDAANPGYIEPAVQSEWRVRYEYPVPPDASKPADRTIPQEVAAPWTWRLAPYFDHDVETIWRYRNAPAMNWPALVALARDGGLDDIGNVDDLMAAVAEEPAFGYNGFHVGGWWMMQQMPGAKSAGTVPLPRFFDAKSINGGGSVEVVARTIPGIRRPADLIVFCTATMHASTGVYRSRDDHTLGSHIVMPPFLAAQPRWQSPPSTNSAYTERIETFAAQTHVPLGRYNGMPTFMHADGSIETAQPVMLFDMRRWIDNPIRTEDPYQAWFSE